MVQALLAAAAVLGALFVLLVPPGLPYDEPSHWQNVLFYATEAQMPELGQAGVSYEAQQGPVAYALAAVVAAPLLVLGDGAAFYGVRFLGLAQHLLLTLLVWRVVHRVSGGRRGAGVLAATAVGLNPIFLAISTSIQNDTLALLLAVAAIDMGMRASIGPRRAAATGIVVGLALITKITVWPVAVVLGIWALRRGRVASGLAYGLPALALIGWWVARNYALYGDATGRAGVRAAGYDFPPLERFDPVGLLRSAVTYLWLPTEYVRNTIEPPLLVVAVVCILTVAGGLGAILLIRHRGGIQSDVILALLSIAVLAVGAWLYVANTSQAVAFRVAYAGIPFWLTCYGAIACIKRWAWVLAGLTLGLLSLSAWFLVEATMLGSFPFLINL